MEKLNNVDVYFNMADVEFYKRYMDNAKTLDEVVGRELTKDESQDYKKAAALFEDKCNAVKAFLDQVCGAGTGDKVCGTGLDICVCIEVYAAIIEIVKRQTEQIQQTMKKLGIRTGGQVATGSNEA